MELSLNGIAIGLATLSSMIVGTVWYLPKVFGDSWMAITGKDPNNPTSKPLAYGGSFVASAITAIVLAIAVDVAAFAFGGSFLLVALATGGILWLGFTATRVLVHELFESRNLRVWAISVGYELVTLLAMAAIIGVFGN
jgi:hypothetical protein